MQKRIPFCVAVITLFLLTLSMLAQAQTTGKQLVWDAPTTNADGTALKDLAGYKIYYGQKSRNYVSSINVGKQTSYPLADLPLVGGQSYYFTVTAYDTSGNESKFSNEITATMPTSGGGPGGGGMVTLYVAYDSRANPYPTWLTSSFTNTGQKITTTDTALTVWRKDVPLGSISLPGNLYGNPGRVGSNYIVFIDFHGNGSIDNLSLANAQVATLGVGDKYYTDRNYTITALPDMLRGLTAIKTANGDKSSTKQTFLTFLASATAPLQASVAAVNAHASSSSQTFQTFSRLPAFSATSTPDNADTVQIWMEAEAGALTSPGEVDVDELASSGAYLWVPGSHTAILESSPDSTIVQHTFTVPKTDTYVIWGRLGLHDAGTGSFSLSVNGTEEAMLDGAALHYTVETLHIGDTSHIDQHHTVTALPGELAGLMAIKTADSEKHNQDEAFLTFTVTQDATVYVAYDAQVRHYPDWLTAAFTNTGSTITTTQGPLAVWRRDVSAGPVTLPGNSHGGSTEASANYLVLLASRGQTALSIWMWDQVAGETAPIFFLEAGEHTLTVKQQEAGAKIDRFLVTNDVDFVPQGLGRMVP